jgi:hypothetical protein
MGVNKNALRPENTITLLIYLSSKKQCYFCLKSMAE